MYNCLLLDCKTMFSNKKYLKKNNNMAWNIEIAKSAPSFFYVHAQLRLSSSPHFIFILFLECNHIDLKFDTCYIKSFVNH